MHSAFRRRLRHGLLPLQYRHGNLRLELRTMFLEACAHLSCQLGPVGFGLSDCPNTETPSVPGL